MSVQGTYRTQERGTHKLQGKAEENRTRAGSDQLLLPHSFSNRRSDSASNPGSDSPSDQQSDGRN